LWRTNGFPLGTTLWQDINPGPASSDPDRFVNIASPNSLLLFAADDGLRGRELWSADGLVTGTKLVRDINPGSPSSNPRYFSVPGAAFFAATTAQSGTELWVTAGTNFETVQLADINPGTAGSFPRNLVASNGIVFMSANDGIQGFEPWGTNGEFGGTNILLDVRTDFATINVAPILNVAGAPHLSPITTVGKQNSGTSVPSILATGAEGNPIDDPNPDARQGIAVIGVNNTNGNWQYSSNSGTTWSNFESRSEPGSLSQTNARLLPSNTSTRIRFVPDTGFVGDVPDGITFRAWNQATGTPFDTADATTYGGESAFSKSYQYASLRVMPVFDIPWQNPENPLDVNADGLVTSLDALLIINRLNDKNIGDLSNPSSGDAPAPFYDVTGDDRLEPIDVLRVINFINDSSDSSFAAINALTAFDLIEQDDAKASATVDALPTLNRLLATDQAMDELTAPVDSTPDVVGKASETAKELLACGNASQEEELSGV
jgi:ELWxxDGT repeat protein